jgi:hypothetical protein
VAAAEGLAEVAVVGPSLIEPAVAEGFVEVASPAAGQLVAAGELAVAAAVALAVALMIAGFEAVALEMAPTRPLSGIALAERWMVPAPTSVGPWKARPALADELAVRWPV